MINCATLITISTPYIVTIERAQHSKLLYVIAIRSMHSASMLSRVDKRYFSLSIYISYLLLVLYIPCIKAQGMHEEASQVSLLYIVHHAQREGENNYGEDSE